ncbi:hypothetical protein Taro_014022 [Colocasia esculenta]|uniref:Uncharacterized protein n=1 Tax=Colocasia esculenta TaxID=4460 RepID=A0A843U820_COLES|nr:hypothetical protein [Colocasia esculenta]
MGVRASKLSRSDSLVGLRYWFGLARGGGRRRQRAEVAAAAALAPRGYVPVWVGVGGETKRFMVHTTSFGDARLLELLCRSAEEYGYRNDGVLRIPYDARSFEEMVVLGRGDAGRRRTSALKVITAS